MSNANDSDQININRRRILINTTTAMGAVGIVGAITPFVKSCAPSEKAKAASRPITQDISALEAGKMMVVEWQSKPIYIIRRTDEMLKKLALSNPKLRDTHSNESNQPEYAKNAHRSRDPHVLVMVGVCTHLGCAPGFRPETNAALDANWTGGFLCPCHGSKYDLAGRVFDGSPAPLNMEIPKHKLIGNILTIGEDA
ncbi:MAG TPA: ubiquinol-cytochrome c reductase iron-sulfur subunit [Aquirhabdus sp.]